MPQILTFGTRLLTNQSITLTSVNPYVGSSLKSTIQALTGWPDDPNNAGSPAPLHWIDSATLRHKLVIGGGTPTGLIETRLLAIPANVTPAESSDKGAHIGTHDGAGYGMVEDYIPHAMLVGVDDIAFTWTDPDATLAGAQLTADLLLEVAIP